MATPEKHPKIRQHQPQNALENKINRKPPTGAAPAMPLHGLSQRIGNRSMQRLLASNVQSGQMDADALPTVQRQVTGTRTIDPADQAKAIFEKAEAKYKAESYDAALVLYEQAYDLAPDKPLFIYNIAQCYRNLGNYPEAINHYKKFLAEDTTSSTYRKKAKKHIADIEGNLQPFETAERLYKEGDYSSAAIWYTRALETFPPERQPLLYYNLGQCNYMLKRYVAALSYYEQFLSMADLDPQMTEKYIEKAKDRRVEMSAELYVNLDTAGEVVKMDQEEARDIFADAQQKYAEKRYAEALDLYMKVNQAHFGGLSTDMLYNIAQCNRNLGRKATAIHFYERSIEAGADKFKAKAEQFITSLRKALGWPDKETK